MRSKLMSASQVAPVSDMAAAGPVPNACALPVEAGTTDATSTKETKARRPNIVAAMLAMVRQWGFSKT
jgi:hypothetical protein